MRVDGTSLSGQDGAGERLTALGRKGDGPDDEPGVRSETCRRSNLRVLGPNCIGFMNLAGGLMADACTKAVPSIPELPAAQQDQPHEIMPKPFYGSTTNPVDTTAQVVNVPGAFEKVLRTLGDSPSVADVMVGAADALMVSTQ